MAVSKEFLDALNQDLALEWSAMIQYTQHASVIVGKDWPIIEELLKHADEEFGHAKDLSDRIDYLGGVPTIDVGERKISTEPLQMIQQDLEGERTAIRRYSERIKQAVDIGDEGTAEILRGILTDEQEHENDLMTAIGNSEKSVTEDLVKEASLTFFKMASAQ